MQNITTTIYDYIYSAIGHYTDERIYFVEAPEKKHNDFFVVFDTDDDITTTLGNADIITLDIDIFIYGKRKDGLEGIQDIAETLYDYTKLYEIDFDLYTGGYLKTTKLSDTTFTEDMIEIRQSYKITISKRYDIS